MTDSRYYDRVIDVFLFNSDKLNENTAHDITIWTEWMTSMDQSWFHENMQLINMLDNWCMTFWYGIQWMNELHKCK